MKCVKYSTTFDRIQRMLEVPDQRFVTLESDPNNTDLLNGNLFVRCTAEGSGRVSRFQQPIVDAHRRKHSGTNFVGVKWPISPAIISIILGNHRRH